MEIDTWLTIQGMNIADIHNAIFYLQYYSIPIVAMLITPILNVRHSLMGVYSPGHKVIKNFHVQLKGA